MTRPPVARRWPAHPARPSPPPRRLPATSSWSRRDTPRLMDRCEWYAAAAQSGCASVGYADDAPLRTDGGDDDLERRRRREHGDDARPLERVVGVLRDELSRRRSALELLDRADPHRALRTTEVLRTGAQPVDLVDRLREAGERLVARLDGGRPLPHHLGRGRLRREDGDDARSGVDQPPGRLLRAPPDLAFLARAQPDERVEARLVLHGDHHLVAVGAVAHLEA